MYVDDASHVGAHWKNGSMRSKPKVVDAQISSTLVHHLTNYVHFHLRMAEKKNQVVVISEHKRLQVITYIMIEILKAPCGVFL